MNWATCSSPGAVLHTGQGRFELRRGIVAVPITSIWVGDRIEDRAASGWQPFPLDASYRTPQEGDHLGGRRRHEADAVMRNAEQNREAVLCHVQAISAGVALASAPTQTAARFSDASPFSSRDTGASGRVRLPVFAHRGLGTRSLTRRRDP